MSISEIGVVATFVVLVAALGVFVVSARFPTRRAMVSPEQAAFLMDQLIAEKNAAKAALEELADQRIENGKLRSEVEDLRAEVATLWGQIENLWSMMRGQAVAQSSVEAATRPAQPGLKRQLAAQMTDSDVAFRDWLARHFDGADILILCADIGMERPAAGSITEMATALVQAARRTGFTERLEAAALDRRPNVEAW